MIIVKRHYALLPATAAKISEAATQNKPITFEFVYLEMIAKIWHCFKVPYERQKPQLR